ncbi:CDP-glycerol glycerophosphotransferase family protein [Limosilactobacillus reuteri]|uniref:CDP-glycerol glycerophosphotransferase family protein n=1 Tax=Limosilactobacillus reuteri TaxID=1598 RepID=UPI003F1FFBF4
MGMSIIRNIYHFIVKNINILCFSVCSFLPIEPKLIVLESEGDFTDNAEALFYYIKRKELLNTYKVVWLVDNPEQFKNEKNVYFVKKAIGKLHIKAMYYLARCKFYIYDHNNLLQYEKLKKRSKQVIIYMSHGTAFKNGRSEDPNAADYFDKVVTLGDMSTKIICHFWGCDEKKALELGEPREDYYFSNLDYEKDKLEVLYNLSEFDKCLLWMPTFRQSYNSRISEEYKFNETGLPIIRTEQDLRSLNSYLQAKKICLLLKIHHLQADMPIFLTKLSNIKIIKDKDLAYHNIKLYKLIALTDALITDYSSISIDYLPLDKQIIYTLDDYEEYRKSRGVYPYNAIDYMPGAHVFNLKQLEDAITDIANNNDKFSRKRKLVMRQFYKYKPGESSKRILEYLNILK